MGRCKGSNDNHVIFTNTNSSWRCPELEPVGEPRVRDTEPLGPLYYNTWHSMDGMS